MHVLPALGGTDDVCVMTMQSRTGLASMLRQRHAGIAYLHHLTTTHSACKSCHTDVKSMHVRVRVCVCVRVHVCVCLCLCLCVSVPVPAHALISRLGKCESSHLRVWRSCRDRGLYRSSSGSGVKLSTAKLLNKVPAAPKSPFSAHTSPYHSYRSLKCF